MKKGKTKTYKIVQRTNGKCSVYSGGRRIVTHEGSDALSKCKKASKLHAQIFGATGKFLVSKK